MTKSLILLLLCTTTTAFAQVATWTGSLDDSDPTYNRTYVNGSGLSNTGTSNYYDVQPFWVESSATYTFESSLANDGMIFVYSSFNPANPVADYLAGSDDYYGDFSFLNDLKAKGSNASRLEIHLTPWTQYFAITTTYERLITGDYANAIGYRADPNHVPVHLGVYSGGAVPEPSCVVVLAAGLIALDKHRRKRRGSN